MRCGPTRATLATVVRNRWRCCARRQPRRSSAPRAPQQFPWHPPTPMTCRVRQQVGTAAGLSQACVGDLNPCCHYGVRVPNRFLVGRYRPRAWRAGWTTGGKVGGVFWWGPAHCYRGRDHASQRTAREKVYLTEKARVGGSPRSGVEFARSMFALFESDHSWVGSLTGSGEVPGAMPGGVISGIRQVGLL